MAPQYWLLKTEPQTYSFAQLTDDKRTNWNGVRNYQARNNLRKMANGDLALIYHSGEDKAVVGVAKVVREGYKDPDPEGGDWTQVDVQAVSSFAEPVPLSQIKKTVKLATMPLIKHTRLSVMPILETHFQMLLKMGGAK